MLCVLLWIKGVSGLMIITAVYIMRAHSLSPSMISSCGPSFLTHPRFLSLFDCLISRTSEHSLLQLFQRHDKWWVLRLSLSNCCWGSWCLNTRVTWEKCVWLTEINYSQHVLGWAASYDFSIMCLRERLRCLTDSLTQKTSWNIYTFTSGGQAIQQLIILLVSISGDLSGVILENNKGTLFTLLYILKVSPAYILFVWVFLLCALIVAQVHTFQGNSIHRLK